MALLAFLSPSPLEMVVIAVIALLVLGPDRLPEAARSVGKGMREMRNSFQAAQHEDEDVHAYEDEDEDEEPEEIRAPAENAATAAKPDAE
jgi:sec-independent protein translocase protein TatA